MSKGGAGATVGEGDKTCRAALSSMAGASTSPFPQSASSPAHYRIRYSSRLSATKAASDALEGSLP